MHSPRRSPASSGVTPDQRVSLIRAYERILTAAAERRRAEMETGGADPAEHSEERKRIEREAANHRPIPIR